MINEFLRFMSAFRCFLLGGLLFVIGSVPSYGQEVDVGGRAYLDYFYNATAPDGAAEELHGFRYRRLYLTTDFSLSEDVRGRARLEADEGTAGRPVVKDLSVTWAYGGDHRATLGITPPPAFERAEDVWGYRSLEKTILDLEGLVSSRDFGLRFDGPVTEGGTVRYAVMYANNQTVAPETDPYKRVYGQIEVRPTERLSFTVGGDYAGYGGERDHATRLSTFGGYSTTRFRVGLEGYWARTARVDGEAQTDLGTSLFGAVQIAPRWEVVGRVDRSRETGGGPDRYDTLLLGGIAFRPHPNVWLIPNLRHRTRGGDETETTVRGTVRVQF